MQTQLAPQFENRPEAKIAESIVRKCVHCGFCTATCPTYQLLGDELDSPRGRIYLIKQVLEGQAATKSVQTHLDRCLTCRNCETTCPSGVDYGHLIDIGKQLVEEQVPRPASEKAIRWMLKEGLNSSLFAPAMKMGQAVRSLLPQKLQNKVPAKQEAGQWPHYPKTGHAFKVLMLEGCVQPSMMPNINTATARVLDKAGIEVIREPNAACCGAIKLHLNDGSSAKDQMRANIDAWWPWLEPQLQANAVQAIVMNASGCGATVKEYAYHLKDDLLYAEKAATISALSIDLIELLPKMLDALRPLLLGHPLIAKYPLVFHPPCTLQHAQKINGGLEQALGHLGFNVRVASNESHLCCGSAGTYSVLQPDLALQLRDRKLKNIAIQTNETLVSANIGCITHLQSGTSSSVRHWVEVIDEILNSPVEFTNTQSVS